MLCLHCFRSASELFGSDEVGNSLEQRGLSDFAASWEGERMLELLRSCGLDSDNACTLREAHKAIERQAIEAKPGLSSFAFLKGK